MTDLSICIFSRGLPPWAYGGVETFTYELSRRLVKLGCRVSVICARSGASAKAYTEIDGVRVHFVDYGLIPNFSYSINAAKKAIDLDRSNSFDIYHGQGFYGFGCALAKAMKRVRKPFVETIHNLIIRETHSCIQSMLFHKASSLLHNLATFVAMTSFALSEGILICRVADGIVADSEYTKIDATRNYGIPSGKITVIPIGVDINRFSPEIRGHKIRKMLNIGSDMPLVLYLGRLDQRKGVEYLVLSAPSVLKEISDAKFLSVGRGPFEKPLKQLTKRLGVQDTFIFHPFISDSHLPSLYAAADVFVLPSRWEGFGISMLEAMATAKPVVSTNVSAIPEVVIHGKTGLLVETGNHHQLAEAIIKILSDRNFAKGLGINGRKRAEKVFNWDVITKKTLELYKLII